MNIISHILHFRMYGFQKLTRKDNQDRGAYFHELFLRSRPGLSRGIRRLKHKPIIDPNNEPNLRLYPAMPQNNVAKEVVQSDNFPRTVHYGISSSTLANSTVISDVPPVAKTLHENNATVQYDISPYACGNINAIPDVPSIAAGVNINDSTVHYGVSQNIHGDTNTVPNVPIVAICNYSNDEYGNFLSSTTSRTFAQAKHPVNLANTPLLERIKQKRKESSKTHSICNPDESSSNTNLSQNNNLVQWIANTSQLNPGSPLSYIIMRVGN